MEKIIFKTENTTEESLYDFPFLQKNKNFYIFIAVSFTFYLVFSLLIFPVYLHIFRRNQEKDKETAIYPITSHFHFVVKCQLYFFFIDIWFVLIIVVYFRFLNQKQGAEPADSVFLRGLFSLIAVALFILNIFALFLLVIFQRVQNLLHFLLALQRFLLYFNPGTEKYVGLTGKSMKRVIGVLYAIGISMVVYQAFLILENTLKHVNNDHLRETMTFPEVVIMLSMNGLLVISIILYLLIMNSVRKLTNLTSAAQSKPQNYIFYQAILLLITKIPTWTCFVISRAQYDVSLGLFQLLLQAVWVIDITQTPFTIQVTYLFCNRRNVNAMFSTVRTFLCPRHLQTASQVNPVSVYAPSLSSQFLLVSMENITLLSGNVTNLIEHADQLFEHLNLQTNEKFLSMFVVVSCAFYLVSAMIMFPIYLHIYGQNREKDKEAAIYPIVNHFHWVARNELVLLMTNASFLFMRYIVSITIPHSEGANVVTGIVMLIATVLAIIIILFLIIFTSLCGLFMLFFQQIQFILHFLLALQRFLLYFYPVTEKYVNLTEKSMKRVIKLLYAMFSLMGFKFLYSFIKAMEDELLVKTLFLKFLSTQVVCILIFNVLLIISIILYLLIMNSVRKLTNLTSAAQNKPQKYIFYQAILLLITRIPTWALFVYCYTQSIVPDGIFLVMWCIISWVDVAQTPFTIQVTYLFCNRRNVNAMFTSVREFFCPSRQTASQVNPVSGVYTTRN